MSQDYRAMSAAELLQELEHAGRAPDLELIRACMERRGELTPGLLDMLAAAGDEKWEEDDPRWYAPIHAGHLLIHFREPQAIPIFMRLFRDPENENLLDWFDTALASYGLAILPAARALLDDAEAPEDARLVVPGILTELAAEFPTERVQVIEILRAALPALDENGKLAIPKPRPQKPNEVWSFVALALAELHDFASRPQIEELYREGWIDESVMGDVGDYRQLLLGSKPLTPQPFHIIETYQALQAAAENEKEWQAKRQEILKQQELLRQRVASARAATASDTQPAQPQTIRRAQPKIGRNDPCPCGSGRKYKHCHGKA
jgi:hypothetical protein